MIQTVERGTLYRGPQRGLGDLAGRPDVARHFINRAIRQTLEARRTHALLGTQTDESAPSIQRHPDIVRKRLAAGVEDFRAYVEMGYKEELEQVATKYREADRESEGKSYEERLAARMGKFKNVILVTDFDGSVTENPAEYLEHIPGSVHAEPLLAQHPEGRHGFGDVFAQTWQPALEETPEAFHAPDAPVKITPGASDLFKMLKEESIPATVVSANFEPFVRHHMGKIEGTEDVEIHGITHDSIVSSAKDAMLKFIAAKNPDSAVIFIGDGSSDEDAIEARDVVALYGARQGLGFQQKLESQAEPVEHFTYNDYHDVKHVVRYAHSLVEKNTSVAA